MKRKLISVLLLIFITFISEKAYAKILNFPDEYLSIKDAINAAEYGDSVLIASGAYYESQINLKSGVTILGADRYTTIIDGSGTAVFYDKTGSNTAIVENLTIRSGMGAAAMFISTPNSSPNIINNVFTDSASGVVFLVNEFGINTSNILNNEFINNNFGIWIGGSPTVNYSNITNNIFTGNDTGIYLSGDSNIEPLIQNNTIDNNGEGIKIDNGPEPRISNNIITNNNGAGILLAGSVYTYIPEKTEEILNSIQYNDVFNNQGGNYVDTRLRDQTGIHGNISEDPLFVDATNGDYHLQPNSPSKDTGDPSILDPDGSRSDMGAYGGPNAKAEEEGEAPPQANPPDLPLTETIRENNAASGLVNLINPNEDPDPNKPSIILVHGRAENSEQWPTTMSSSLKERLDEENYNILAWDWRDAANYPLVDPSLILYSAEDAISLPVKTLYSNALMQGSKLTTELINSNLINQDIHLVAHSAGGPLIAETAATLERLGFDKIEHLTFLDPLDPVDMIDGENALWADNYYSYLIDYVWPPTAPIGSPIKNAYNEDLRVLGSNTHDFPIQWYINTIDNGSIKDGFFWSKEGGGWDEQKPSTTSPSLIGSIATTFVDTFDSIGNWFSSGYVYFSNGIAFFKESSPAYLFEDISIPSDSNFLSFDFKFTQLGDGDLLKLYFDDYFLFAYEGIYFVGSDFMNSGMLDISQFAGRNGKLTFMLDNYGDANSEFAVDNLKFYQASPVPEPSTIFLLAPSLLSLLFVNRKKLKG